LYRKVGLSVGLLGLDGGFLRGRLRFARGDADLRDQAARASRSSVLHIAEGCSRGGKAEKNHYRIALGSAAETCAVLDIVELKDGPGIQEELRRLGAMLHGLSNR